MRKVLNKRKITRENNNCYEKISDKSIVFDGSFAKFCNGTMPSPHTIVGIKCIWFDGIDIVDSRNGQQFRRYVQGQFGLDMGYSGDGNPQRLLLSFGAYHKHGL